MKTTYRLKVVQATQDIPKEEWNALATDETVPFVKWDWLAGLEESKSLGPNTGWHPLHITLWRGSELAAVAPLYLRTSSRGDYVFDNFWAEAAESLNRHWYPKLVGTSPVTPAEGYRFLVAPDLDSQETSHILLDAAEGLCRKNNIPGIHLLFADPQWSSILPAQGYSAWEHNHYLWENTGYADFDEFLGIFNKNQRKNIRKEYRHHLEQGLTIKFVPGEEAGKEHFAEMFNLFTITNDKHYPWDFRFINKKFFQYMEKNMRENTAFVEARRTAAPKPTILSDALTGDYLIRDREVGEIVAMAFFVRKKDRLWGRYWGTYQDVPDLHFAVCYYTPIEWAIQNGIRYFEPGTGGSHKTRRGFRTVYNSSYHKFLDPVLTRLFTQNVDDLNRYEEANRVAVNRGLPFKKEFI